MTEVRLTDVMSDGIEAARTALVDIPTRTVQLPDHGFTLDPYPQPPPGRLAKYMEPMFGWPWHATPESEYQMPVSLMDATLRAFRWLVTSDIPFVFRPRYPGPDRGSLTSAVATLGASDGTLMVEVGRVGGWRVERAVACGFSLLLVPTRSELGLLIDPPRRPGRPLWLPEPVAPPEPTDMPAYTLDALVEADARLYPEVRLWDSRLDKRKAMQAFCLATGMAEVSRFYL